MPDEKGKRPVFFARGRNDVREISLACGQCIGCRLERSREWAVRIMHEAKMHSASCFITLTYSDKFLPPSRSLKIKDYQDFMKRLRKRYGSGLKLYYCGEYGDLNHRPHYHACIFGMDFDDKRFYRENDRGDVQFTSKKLDEIWGMGDCVVGALTFDSAAYVARYCCKKVTGPAAEFHYQWFDLDSRVLHVKVPEFGHMSRRPGIGRSFFNKFMSDVFPSDEVISNGHPAGVPRAYDTWYELIDPLAMEAVKDRRLSEAEKHSDNCTPDRLAVREEVTKSKLKTLRRSL